MDFGNYSETWGFLNGYAKIKNESGYWGLIDIKGNVVIPCMWDEIFYFGGAFATGVGEDYHNMTAYDLRYGGKIIPESKINYFTDGVDSNKFSEGYMRVSTEEGKWGYLSESDNEYNISYDYDYVTDFKHGYACVSKDGVEQVIDKNFKTILSSNDKYVIRINREIGEGLVNVEDPESGKCGFVNLKGEIVIPCVFDDTHDFSDGLCVVHKEGHPGYLSTKNTFGYIDTKGNKVIPEIFNETTSQIRLINYYENDFIDGYAVTYQVKNGEVYATLIGKNGKPLKGFDWANRDIRRFSCGLASFKDHNNKRGYYNTKGETVVPSKYIYAWDFKEGLAVVEQEINGKILCGCINTDGVEIIPLIYDSIEGFENGIALARLNGKMGLIDRFGNSSFLK